ncbi:uncharacterized protein G2W53_039528 [Senna tora]|uniref:Uncharacterized protein n=1 Tax=Senna tora TaxID=362788 RepID=A0A834W2W2_9FABA|nr:uncharacterized protein G2W53_039528 [Senna tora]
MFYPSKTAYLHAINDLKLQILMKRSPHKYLSPFEHLKLALPTPEPNLSEMPLLGFKAARLNEVGSMGEWMRDSMDTVHIKCIRQPFLISDLLS